MSTYLDKILKEFKMDESKKEFLPVLQGVKLSKDRKPNHGRREKENESHSLCLSHRFYKVCHAMYQTSCVPCYEFGKGVR